MKRHILEVEPGKFQVVHADEDDFYYDTRESADEELFMEVVGDAMTAFWDVAEIQYGPHKCGTQLPGLDDMRLMLMMWLASPAGGLPRIKNEWIMSERCSLKET